MRLTQSKLATLAAILPKGTAKERVQLAGEIWDQALIEAASRRLEIYEAMPPVWQDFPPFLAELLPKKVPRTG